MTDLTPSPAAAPIAAATRPRTRIPRPSLAPRWAALALASWCTVGLNQAWWARLEQLAHEQSLSTTEQLLTALVLTAATFLWFMLLSWPGLRRVGWSATLVTAAAVQYFMLRYGIVVDSGMVRNALQTNTSETLALLGSGLLVHVLLYAGLPLALLWGGVRLQTTAWRRDLWRSALLVLASAGAVVGGSMLLYKPMAPLVRNHTEIRYLLNPLATVTSVSNVTIKPLFKPQRPFQRISEDAALGASYAAHPLQPTAASAAPARKPPLLVLVVGETARSDHFGLNGYPRNTTPEMEARHVISWRNVRSCGTNTLASVPCMFSHLGKEGFEGRKLDYDNLLDVLQSAGLGVDWLDNQAGCKGVCSRIPHSQADQVASPDAVRQWCKDDECLDQIMVDLLDQRLSALNKAGQNKGTVLVLHQMGSHGPAYHRRSAPAHKRFTPECATHVTSDCSRGELVNVYDNSIVETDHFISRTIDWLQTQQDRFDTGLIYLSDHGESLGENGLYLHGLPYVIAPDVQKHVPWVLWPGTLLERTQVAERCLRAGTDAALTHDHFYHSVLGLLDVLSHTYQPALDAFASCRTAGRPHAA